MIQKAIANESVEALYDSCIKDLKNEVVAIIMCQTPSAYPLEFRKDFRKWVMKSLVK
jgi:hypothetical protein